MPPKVTDEHRDKKKQLILEAAEKVFIRKGYKETTMKDIVDESGLSRGGVYLYFSSCEEIFRGILEVSDERYIFRINELSVQSRTAWDGIVQLINSIKREMFFIKSGLAGAIYEYFLSVKRNGEEYDLLKKRFDQALAGLCNLLEKGVESGEFHPVYPIYDISKFLIFFMDGISVNLIGLGCDNVNLDSQTDQIILYLKNALGVVSFE